MEYSIAAELLGPDLQRAEDYLVGKFRLEKETVNRALANLEDEVEAHDQGSQAFKIVQRVKALGDRPK